MCKREHAFRIPNDSLTQPSPSTPQSMRVSVNTHCSVVSSDAPLWCVSYDMAAIQPGGEQHRL